MFYMNINLTKEEIELVIMCLRATQSELDSTRLSGSAGNILADNSLNIHLIRTRLEWQLNHGEK